jgi:hypothetical protein
LRVGQQRAINKAGGPTLPAAASRIAADGFEDLRRREMAFRDK